MNISDRKIFSETNHLLLTFSKTGRKTDSSDLKRHITSLLKINFTSFFFPSLFLGPKGSKSTQSLQSSNQEHVATCEDVILTKPAGIIQFPRYFHRTIRRWGWNFYYNESFWMITWQAATFVICLRNYFPSAFLKEWTLRQ